MSLFGGPKSRRLRQLTLFVLAALIATSSESMAKPRKQQYGNPTAAMPEDPQAYAMRIARQTWPGRDLCDDGGYRIRPCDIGGRSP
jgi:hypothetical protein